MEICTTDYFLGQRDANSALSEFASGGTTVLRDKPLSRFMTTFDKISAKELVTYIIVFVAIIIFFQNKNINKGSIFGLIIAIVSIYLLYYHNSEKNTSDEKIHQLKADTIIPSSKNIGKYTDITDFVFSIQDFYTYNPQSFESIVNQIDTFLDIYAYVMIDNSLAGEHYYQAERCKQLALTHLRSLMIMIPTDKKIINKLDVASDSLEKLLNEYLIKIYERNNKYFETNGYFNNSKVIDLQTTPYNFDDNLHDQ